MSWAVAFDARWQRYVGYGVPAICDFPECGAPIDRGLAYVCGGDPFGGQHGCGLYLCGDHRSLGRVPADMFDPLVAGDDTEDDGQWAELCGRCHAGGQPFEHTPDVREWLDHIMTHETWSDWRLDCPGALQQAWANLATAPTRRTRPTATAAP